MHVQEQVYGTPAMVKGKNRAQVLEALMALVSRFEDLIESDFSNFDSGQNELLLYIEELMYEYFVGHGIGKSWGIASCKGMDLKFNGGRNRVIGSTMRNSGEKSTSIGNTVLTMLIVAYTQHEPETLERETKVLLDMQRRGYPI